MSVYLYDCCKLQLLDRHWYLLHHTRFMPSIPGKAREVGIIMSGHSGIDCSNGSWIWQLWNSKTWQTWSTKRKVWHFADSELLCAAVLLNLLYSLVITLHPKLSGAVYCCRSCLWWASGRRVCGCVCLWVCYHDNSKLRALIFTKLGL